MSLLHNSGEILAAYLAALQPTDGLPVRICTAVDENGFVRWSGTNHLDEDTIRHLTSRHYERRPFCIRWIEATVRPFEAPVEHVTQGREVNP